MSDKKDPARLDADGVIYFNLIDIPDLDVLSDSIEFTPDETHPYTIGAEDDTPRVQGTLYERRLAHWKDLTTPPKTKSKCTKMCRVGPLTTCCRWKAYAMWLYRTATLRVTTTVPVDISSAIEDCLKQAAIAAAVAAIISGGTAAAAAAEKVFFTCLSSKLGSDLLGVKIDLKSSWGDWTPV